LSPEPFKILLVRLGALGDLVHGLPVAAALRRRFPDARIDWLVAPRHAPLLAMVPVIDRAIEVGGAVATIRRLRQARYDAAVDLQGLIKSAAFARLSGARRVIGFDRRHLRERPASVFYTETRDPAGAVHVVDKNLSLLSAFDIPERDRQFPIAVPPSPAALEVARLTAERGRPGYALLNPGAAWPNKRWPEARFGALAAWLAAEHDVLPVVLWGPAEDGAARRIARLSGGAAVPAPPTTVADVLSLARGARLMVSGDTGPLHLAAAMGAAIVALFGPTDPARNGPWGPADISLSRFGDCVCHYRRRCRRPVGCIEDITVEDVRGAIDRRLAAIQSHA
jgi:heptosyltransferase I